MDISLQPASASMSLYISSKKRKSNSSSSSSNHAAYEALKEREPLAPSSSPGSKRTRLSHAHPLSRSASSSCSHILNTASPKAFVVPMGPAKSAVALSLTPSAAASHIRQQCIVCKRLPTSTLAASKFKKCGLCSGLACVVCVRHCARPGTALKREPEVHVNDLECPGLVCSNCAVENAQGVTTCNLCLSRSPLNAGQWLGDEDGDDGSGLGQHMGRGIFENAMLDGDQAPGQEMGRSREAWQIGDYDFSNTE